MFQYDSLSLLQLDRTKRIYFGEETEAEAVRDKAKSAEDKARGRKKDMSSLFKSKAALKKQAGLLSKQSPQNYHYMKSSLKITM